MGRRGPKPRHSVDALLDAALVIVTEQGLQALTIGGLAEVLGTSASGLYRYFPSKEAILVGLQERAIDAYHEKIRDALDVAPISGDQAPEFEALLQILRAFGAWLDVSHEDPASHRLIDAFLSSPAPVLSDEQARYVDARLEPLLRSLDSSLEAAVSAGALREGPVRQRSYLLFAALHGLDHFRKRDRIQPAALQAAGLVPALFEALLAGWGAPTKALEEALTVWRDRRSPP